MSLIAEHTAIQHAIFLSERRPPSCRLRRVAAHNRSRGLAELTFHLEAD